MTFTHNWHLDWIISHQTLRSLTLDDCPIMYDSMSMKPIDSEQYPILGDDNWKLPEVYEYEDKVIWKYGTRWHDCFRKLKGLPRLIDFGFGHGPWSFHRRDNGAVLPFRKGASLPTQITSNRYCMFDCDWVEAHHSSQGDNAAKTNDPQEQYVDNFEDEEDAPSYPDCRDEDQEALNELPAVIRNRRTGRAV